MRICSLLPSATEILFALGLGDHVVAVSHECDYPLPARGKPQVTTGLVDPEVLSSAEIDEIITQALTKGYAIYHIDMDVLRATRPDLLITQELCTVCAVEGSQVRHAASLLSPAPRILSLQPESVAGVLDSIRQVGAAAGVADRAEELMARLSRRVTTVGAMTADLPRPGVLCLEWLDPAWVAGHWMPEAVELAGGLDLLGTQGSPSRRVVWAEIAEAAPEVAILMPCGFGVERTLAEVDVLRTVPVVGRLPAFRSGRVYAVDGSSYFSRPGPRLVDGLELLAALLHPERFPGPVDPDRARKLSQPLNGTSRKIPRLKFEPID